MAKKTLKKRTTKAKKSGLTQLTDPVLDSARDIWRAGLGAASLAQQEGSKVIGQGTAMFDSLVKEGARVEAQGRKAVDDGTSTVTKKVKSRRDAIENRIDAAKKQAEDGWDRLENVFEDRVARVLEGLGIPTSDDMSKLNRQVENLSKQVARLADQRQKAAKAAKSAPARAKAAPAAKAKAKTKGDRAPEATVYHLLPKEDQWAVRREGEDRNLRVLDTKREALDAARSIAQAHEPSRLVVHRADGTIQDSFSYGED